MVRKWIGTLFCAALPLAADASEKDDHLASLPDGRRLHISCVGAGAPTVILESGLGLPMASWSKVQSALKSHARVCAYERAGYGSSDPGPMPRDAARVEQDLAALVKAEGLPKPYVLVGHSLGAHFVRLYAARHPQDVAGIVLVDPIIQDNDNKLAAASPEAASAIARDNQQIERCVGALALGRRWSATDAEYAACGPPPPPASPFASPTLAQTTLSEFRNREVSAAEVASATRNRPAPPMIVLTAKGKRSGALDDVQDVLRREHAAIAQTSKQGSARTVEGSGHVIQYDKPEAVAQAVDDLIGMLEGRR